MQNFTTALKAEHIKKKGTGFYILAIILGGISPVISAIIAAFDDVKAPPTIPYNYYLEFTKGCLDPFAGFFFPLLIIITVSRITQLDHKNGGWQLMETQPVRKFSVYFSKFTVILIANLIAIASLIIVSHLCALILSFIIEIPKVATTGIAGGELLLIALRLFLAAIILTALQYCISVLMPSFIWSMLVGFFLLLLFLFLKGFEITPDWYPLEPLSKISAYKEGSDLGYWLTYSEYASLLIGIILLYIGFEWYRHKRFGRAFFGNAARAAKLALVLAVFGGLLAYALYPNRMEPHSRTVIAGKFESSETFSRIYVRDLFVNDTIAIIPVKDNSFHYVIQQGLPLDNYEFLFGNNMKGVAVLGDNDSLYMEIKKYGNNMKMKATGTRLAESTYTGAPTFSWSSVEYYLQENRLADNPKKFTTELTGEWKDAISTSSKFKTVDNYIPREDFLSNEKKIITLKYLNYWNAYLKTRDAMFPGEATPETAEIKEMKKTVPLNDAALLSKEAYFDYIRSGYIAENKDDIDENSKALKAIAKLQAGPFKDKMLYWQLSKSLRDASDKQERDQLVAQFAYSFKDKRYSSITLNTNRLIESMDKGRPAPIFEANTLDNEAFALADLKGKVVVIDVWATWCAPCREQSPYFEKLAIKYKDEPVQFVALSIDKRIDHWFVDAKSKSKSVLQLHTSEEEKFSDSYNLQGIPRFIFIDANGNFISANAPRPSEESFEKLLRESLGLKG